MSSPAESRALGDGAAPKPAHRGLAPALRNRDFALFWGAHVISRVGTQMRDVAISWHVYLLTKSPLSLGLLGVFRVAPIVALALIGGMAADALDRRRMMIATQTVLMSTSLAMVVLTASGAVTSAMLYALVALSAAATAFDNPARQAVVVNLLPDEDVPNGLTLGIFGWQAATVVGPAIGGALLAMTSVGVIYAIDAASFLAVIAALVVIRPRDGRRRDAGAVRDGFSLRAAAEVFRFLATKPILIWLIFVDFTATFFAGSMQLLPIFAAEIFHAGASGLGLLTAAPAAGAVLASAWLSSRPPIQRQGLAVLGAVVVYGASISGFGLSGSLPLALALLAISGAADTVSTVVRQVVRQLYTPDELRGRMTAVTMVFFMGGPQLGEFEAGVVAQLFTARISVVSGGVACVAMAAIVSACAPRLRALVMDEAGARA